MIASVALVAKTPATPPATDVAIVEAAVDEPIAVAAAAVVTAAFDAAAAIPATIAEIVILNNPPRRDLLLEFFFVTLRSLLFKFKLFKISTKK